MPEITGPDALALALPLYNGLFRLYPDTDVSQIQHLRHLCTRGRYKAPLEVILIQPPSYLRKRKDPETGLALIDIA